MMTTKEALKKYGTPNEAGTYLKMIKLPYKMRIAWDTKTTVDKMRCHKDHVDNFLGVFNELLEVYGYEKIVELGIDLFGGCFSYRKMRNGSSWSKHSWGIAIDLDPARNGLKTPFAKANFSKPEYDDLHRVFEKHGFINLGKIKNMDAMHWEIKG